MKTLANCTTVEFLRQTNKIRHEVSDFLIGCGVDEMRKRKPTFTEKDTPEDKKRKLDEQAKKNTNDILDSLLDTNAEKTADLLGLMCFMEPGEMGNASISNVTAPIIELLGNQNVMDFLLSLAKLGLMSTGA